MIVGTTLFYLDGNPYYTPEIPRGGLAAVFTVDVTQINLITAAHVDIEVEHRNSEDTSWTSVVNFTGVNTLGVKTADASFLKEIVRLKFSFSGAPSAGDSIHFLVQAPTWRPYV